MTALLWKIATIAIPTLVAWLAKRTAGNAMTSAILQIAEQAWKIVEGQKKSDEDGEFTAPEMESRGLGYVENWAINSRKRSLSKAEVRTVQEFFRIRSQADKMSRALKNGHTPLPAKLPTQPGGTYGQR